MGSEALPARTLHHLVDSIQPAWGAVVMGTGIVSIALRLDGHTLLSVILLVIAAGVWLALGVLLGMRARRDEQWLTGSLHDPTALTAVADTAVLGTGLTLAGWCWAGDGLLVLGTAIWLGLVAPVLNRWRTPTIGASFILTVATESIALLAVTLGVATDTGWLVVAALVPFCLGLGSYAFVLRRFDFRHLLTGVGDHWVSGGALAISTLAAGRLALASLSTAGLTGAHETLKIVAFVLWWLTVGWLPALVAAEIIRRRLFYDVRRWATVFPVGMYAACSFAVGELVGSRAMTDFARIWVWVSVAVWVLAFGAMARRTPALVRQRGG